MQPPVCSLIVVNYNGLRHLQSCFEALQNLAYPRKQLDLIMVDNGSHDGSIDYVKQAFPEVRIFINTANNFAKALNLGVAQAQGQYIGFLNNDVMVEPQWLRELVKLLEEQSTAGGAAGKILFKNGRINSIGHRQLPDFYFEDLGFNEEDRGQYDTTGQVEGLCWAAVLFRKECLQDVGPVDEDFVMYFEDVDFAARCRARGWKLLYTHRPVAYHEFQGSSRGTSITYYFCNRNRFLYLAKHFPSALPQSITTSHFFINGQYDLILDCMPLTIKKLFEYHAPKVLEKLLSQLCRVLVSLYGKVAVNNLLLRMQVVLGHRKISLGIYDHALHAIGGGQKYVATIATNFQDEFDITYIANKPMTIADLESWYHLNLSKCKLKVIPMPFYDKQGRQCIDSSMVSEDTKNPFNTIAEESANYDVFLNANMLEKVKPLAPISIFVCHFPDTFRSAYFAVDDYTFIIANCQYSTAWLKKRWHLEPTFILYPPVQMEMPRTAKESLILAVARFEPTGSKKQLEIIHAFRHLIATYPEQLHRWRLVLVGGSLPRNPYLQEVLHLVKGGPGAIEVKVNASFDDLQSLYAKATIFWHACGINETDPHLIEHFGMTTVEAMQNYCVPVVINGGGQREIVEHGTSGFLFNTLDELCQYTVHLIAAPDLLRQLQEGAYERSQRFTRARFDAKVKQFFDIIREEYVTIHLPDPAAVARQISGATFPLSRLHLGYR